MRIVFMGTPDFSVGALDALNQAGHEIALVVTQPDKKKGRGNEVSMSPVKEYALAHNLQVFQPVKVRDEEAIKRLAEVNADVFVVAAFGQILPQAVLDLPKHGCINIHASLLPALRGASPIQQAILDGAEKTGITIMAMDAGCDTGDILLQKEVVITSEDTGGSLFEKLSVLGAGMIVEALSLLEEGKLPRVKQNHENATMTGKIDKASGKIDWTKEAGAIARAVRAFTPWPGSFTDYKGKTLKIFHAAALEAGDIPSFSEAVTTPGTVAHVDKDSFSVACGNGVLRIDEVQLAGKKRMKVHDFLLGAAMHAGDVLG